MIDGIVLFFTGKKPLIICIPKCTFSRHIRFDSVPHSSLRELGWERHPEVQSISIRRLVIGDDDSNSHTQAQKDQSAFRDTLDSLAI